MATLPDWLANVPTVGKWIAGTVAGLAATVAGWTSIGGPIPASQQWTVAYVQQREAQATLREDINRLRALLEKTESQEVREGLERQIAELEARLEG